MINTKTKIKKSISEGNIVEEEECDSVTIVLMGVEIVQNLRKDGNVSRKKLVNKCL